jgi:hypothetical protein
MEQTKISYEFFKTIKIKEKEFNIHLFNENPLDTTLTLEVNKIPDLKFWYRTLQLNVLKEINPLWHVLSSNSRLYEFLKGEIENGNFEIREIELDIQMIFFFCYSLGNIQEKSELLVPLKAYQSHILDHFENFSLFSKQLNTQIDRVHECMNSSISKLCDFKLNSIPKLKEFKNFESLLNENVSKNLLDLKSLLNSFTFKNYTKSIKEEQIQKSHTLQNNFSDNNFQLQSGKHSFLTETNNIINVSSFGRKFSNDDLLLYENNYIKYSMAEIGFPNRTIEMFPKKSGIGSFDFILNLKINKRNVEIGFLCNHSHLYVFDVKNGTFYKDNLAELSYTLGEFSTIKMNVNTRTRYVSLLFDNDTLFKAKRISSIETPIINAFISYIENNGDYTIPF